MGDVDADPEVAATQLVALPGLGTSRLAALLADTEPVELRHRFLRGRPPSGIPAAAVAKWPAVLAAGRRPAIRRLLDDRGWTVTWQGAVTFPGRLVEDPEPAAVLFAEGDLPGPEPTVAIVGTRGCTRYGSGVARELGRALAAVGVRVVSGLARGVDGAAHAGSLDVDGAPPVAVVGSGLDVVYPSVNEGLWRRVASAGCVVTEAAPGSQPARWRFPARNRLIVGLADAVVVVESRERGGSMSTVEAALRRDVPVLAVPGPITSGASAGTNRLVADGAVPVCDVDDVLVAIGRDLTGSEHIRAADPAGGVDGTVLDAVGWTPATLETVVAGTGLGPAEAAVAVERLVGEGRLRWTGQWIERVVAR